MPSLSFPKRILFAVVAAMVLDLPQSNRCAGVAFDDGAPRHAADGVSSHSAALLPPRSESPSHVLSPSHSESLPLSPAVGRTTSEVIGPVTQTVCEPDRFWLVSTRHLLSNACRADLDSPTLRFYQLDRCGRTTPVSSESYLASRDGSRPTVIYVHGNRMESCDAIERGLFVYREVMGSRCASGSVDWVIWSWPSQKTGLLLKDVRTKAARTDAQGLYLAWLLREHATMGQPTTMIGYSFGARVVSGALHALAGGSLAGRALPGATIQGAGFNVAMLAPAIENNWLSDGGYHRLATRNMNQLTVLYNHRDAVLRNYWRISNIRNADALGYTGPTSFAPRFDGSRLPVRSKDCAPVIGIEHDEVEYYRKPCQADTEIALLVGRSLMLHE